MALIYLFYFTFIVYFTVHCPMFSFITVYTRVSNKNTYIVPALVTCYGSHVGNLYVYKIIIIRNRNYVFFFLFTNLSMHKSSSYSCYTVVVGMHIVYKLNTAPLVFQNRIEISCF